jgi:hypothetical protein
LADLLWAHFLLGSCRHWRWRSALLYDRRVIWALLSLQLGGLLTWWVQGLSWGATIVAASGRSAGSSVLLVGWRARS